MIQIGNDGGLLPRRGDAQAHPRRPGAPAADGPGGLDGRVPDRHRRHDQGALPRARRARRRDRRLLQGPGRLQAHPVQRRAGAGAQRRQPGGLLHRRQGPDDHRRRAGHPARVRAQHAHDHAVPGGRTRRGAVRPRRVCRRPCRPRTRRRRTPCWSRPPPTPRRTATSSRPPATAGERGAGGAGGGQGHAHLHASRPRLPAHPAGAGQDGERPLRPGVRPQDGRARRGRPALRQRHPDRRAVLRRRPGDRVPGGG